MEPACPHHRPPSRRRAPAAAHPSGGRSRRSPSSAWPCWPRCRCPPGSASTSRAAPRSSWRPRTAARVKADASSTDRALEVLRGRVDALGVAEPTLARAGEQPDHRRAARGAGPARGGAGDRPDRPARLPRRARARPRRGAGAGGHDQGAPTSSGQPILLGPQVLDGNGVQGRRRPSCPRTASARGSSPWPSTGEGAPQWRQLVDRACADPAGGRRIAILLDREVISSPAVQPELCSGAGLGHPDHRPVHPAQRRRPGHPDQGRRPAGARRGHRAAHRRRHPRRRRDRRVGRGRDHRHRADRAVHRGGLPADGADGDAGARRRTR